MREVSTRACEVLLVSLDDERIPPQRLLADLPVTLDTLRDPEEWIDWDLFAVLLERFEEVADGIDPAMRAGARLVRGKTLSRHEAILDAFRDLRQVYEIGGRILTAAYYTHMRRSFEPLPDGRFRIVDEIPRSYRGCEAFFRLRVGSLRATPRLVGQRDAEVEAQITPHRGTYVVTPPRTSVASRLLRLPRRRAIDRSLALLAHKEEALRARRGLALDAYGTAGSSARDMLDALGVPLMVVDLWGDGELRVFGINRLMELLTGLRDRDVAGRRLHDVMGTSSRSTWLDLAWRCIEQRRVVEAEHRDERGERLRIQLVPSLGSGGDVVRIYATALRSDASPERESLDPGAAAPRA